MATKQPVSSSGGMASLMEYFTATAKDKDIAALKNSIDNLSKILEQRVGKAKKSSGSAEDKEDKQRTLVGDIKDFSKGFISPFTDPKKYIFGGKNTMPSDIDLKTNEDAEKSDNKVLTLSQFKNELVKMKNTDLEKNLLAEVVVIRKIVAQKSGYGDKPALSGTGIEPNNEEDKQKDRELLAEAIANKLKGLANDNKGGGIISSILEALGLKELLDGGRGKGSGKGGRKGGKVPPVSGGGKVPPVPGGGMLRLARLAGMGAGRVAGGIGLGVGAYEASEFLDETGYGDKMAAGAGKKAEKAFRENVAPTIDPVKTGMTPEEARNALGGSERDVEKLGGREALLKIANTDFQSSSSSKDLKEQLRIKEQSLKNLDPSLESNTQYRDKLQTDIDALNKRIPTADMPDQMAAETARLNRYSNIETKQSSSTAESINLNRPAGIDNLYSSIMKDVPGKLEASTSGGLLSNLLKNLENENVDLKYPDAPAPQMLAPMISNKTVDNSRTQYVTSPPKPYPTPSGYDSWQNKRY